MTEALKIAFTLVSPFRNPCMLESHLKVTTYCHGPGVDAEYFGSLFSSAEIEYELTAQVSSVPYLVQFDRLQLR